jgi:hypothetical protein
VLVAAAAISAIACGGAASDFSSNGAGSSTGATGPDGGGAGQAGTGGAAQAGTGGAGQSDADGSAGITGSPADFETLEQCGPSACGVSYAQLVELSARTVHENDARCVLVALRDRTPGLYMHEASLYASSGGAGTEHRLVVAADGSVLHAQHTYNGAIIGQPATDEYSPAQRCTLRDPAYFQACIDAVDGATQADDDAAWACLYGASSTAYPTMLSWIQSCVAAEAGCG